MKGFWFLSVDVYSRIDRKIAFIIDITGQDGHIW